METTIYRINWTELSHYQIEIEATSLEDAKTKFANQEYDVNNTSPYNELIDPMTTTFENLSDPNSEPTYTLLFEFIDNPSLRPLITISWKDMFAYLHYKDPYFKLNPNDRIKTDDLLIVTNAAAQYHFYLNSDELTFDYHNPAN